MKKMIAMFITVLVLLLASCATPYISSGPMVTVTPKILSSKDVLSEEEKEDNHKEQAAADKADAKDAYTELLESIKTAMKSLPKERELSPTELEYTLLDYKEGSIIVACRLKGWYNESSPEFTPDYHNIELSDTVQIMFIAANEFTLKDGKLIDKGFTSVPVLVKTSLGDNDIEKIYLPEMYDSEKRAEDIQNIFGEYADEVTLEVNKYKLAQSMHQVSKVLYRAFLIGAFDSFPNKITAIQKEMIENNLFDDTTIEGAIRLYYAENYFSYSSLTIPFWYEFSRQEDGEGTSPVLYLEMYYGKISLDMDNNLLANKIIAPNRIKIVNENDKLELWYLGMIYPFEENFDELVESTDYPKELIENHFSFIDSSEYNAYTSFCDSTLENIIDGTFDFDNNSLTYTR
jgi:hypothetical protein